MRMDDNSIKDKNGGNGDMGRSGQSEVVIGSEV